MNYENFIRVLTYIEQHPEEWDQLHWCGTACCIAGHSQKFLGQSGARLYTPQAARKFLGLPPKPSWTDFAGWLFHPSRTLDDFRRIRLVACRANYAKVKS